MSLYKKLKLLMNKDNERSLPKIILIMIVSMFLEAFTVGLILPAIGIMMNERFLEKVPVLNNSSFLKSLPQTTLILLGIFCLVVVYMAKSLFLIYSAKCQSNLVYRVQISLSSRLFAGYLRQPWAFHLQRSSSKLMQNIMNETTNFVAGVLSPALTLVVELLVTFGAVLLLMLIKPKETFCIIGFFIIMASLYYLITNKKALKWGKDRFVSDEKRMLQLQQGFRCIKEVKILAKEKYFAERYNIYSQISANFNCKYKLLIDIPKLLLELVAVIGLAILILLLVQYEPVENILPIVALFAAVAFRLMPSANRIVSSLNSLRFSKSTINSLYDELILISEKKQDKSNDVITFEHKLVLKNISYRYQGREINALRDINLTICHGTSVGIIGQSGAGKSTLIDLILGLISPLHGSIKIDDIDISNNLLSWQKQIGYIPQTIHLLDDTIKRNVAFGLLDEEIDDVKVIQALKLAELDSYVSNLPQKFDTYIGEDGVKMSGGQRQRLGIARALYNDPKVLILDEATSSLDVETENEVMKTFYGLYGQKTLLIITHRESTIKNCDVIYKMINGEIVEEKVISQSYELLTT